MKMLLISAFPLLAVASAARADIFSDYETLATGLADRTSSGTSIESIGADHQTLIDLGLQIMDLYGDANPKCAEQYAQIKVEAPSVDARSFDEIFRRYHSAQGLPLAPRHCYFGRSLVAHPWMTSARFRDGLTATERHDAAADYTEVAEHIATVKRNIENPPN